MRKTSPTLPPKLRCLTKAQAAALEREGHSFLLCCFCACLIVLMLISANPVFAAAVELLVVE